MDDTVQEKNTARSYQKIKVSYRAYQKMKEMARQAEYRGRGLVGVIDKLVLGEFSTKGSGRHRRDEIQ